MSEEPIWKNTKQQNLIRYEPSGTYFARFKAGGKLIRKSLGTTVFSVAKLRLPDVIKEHRKISESRDRFRNGKMTVGDAIRVYEHKLELTSELKPRSKYYYRLVLDFIVKSWTGLADSDCREISESDCTRWLARFRRRYAASVTNSAIGVMRAIFRVHGDPETGTKNSESRVIPIIPELKALLQELRSERIQEPAKKRVTGAGV